MNFLRSGASLRAKALSIAMLAAAQIALLGSGCAVGPEASGVHVHRMRRSNPGPELYSAWFGDARDGILYFGLSPFWQRMRESGGDPTGELRESGALLVGRFDLRERRHLAPLVVADTPRAESTWDVLAHSNGRIYFTTFFGPMGSVRADGSDPRQYEDLGSGLNELWEAEDGRIFVTRYGPATSESPSGSLVILTPEGQLIDEWRVPALPDTRVAPKSVAVESASGDVWINTDTFPEGRPGRITHESLRLSSTGEVESRSRSPELMMLAFDRRGTGWFAERDAGSLRLRTVGSGETRRIDLGPIASSDFAQDIKFSPNGAVVLTLWSGRVHVLSAAGVLRTVELAGPGNHCEETGGPGLHYTAILWRDTVFATRHCGPVVVQKRVGLR